MSFRCPSLTQIVTTAIAGAASMFSSACFGANEPEVAAVSALGKGDSAVIQLVRELTEWKTRAETAEALLSKEGVSFQRQVRPSQLAQARVVGSLESERIVILSAGRSSGAVLGALLSVGDGVVAKVVESREAVSAAVVDQKYHGKLGALEGTPARLLVARP